MLRNWHFDKDFLNTIIKEGKYLLSKNNIEIDKKDLITTTILKFSEFLEILNNDYVAPKLKMDSKFDLDQIKNKFLIKAKRDYKKYWPDFIELIIYLSNKHSYVGFGDKYYKKEELPEEIVNKSLDIYKEYFPCFYDVAKEIIDCPISLINFSKKDIIGSQCYYECFLDLPFIHVEEYDKNPSSFIHELQHGVEEIEHYNSYIYFREVGPILMETLYIDKMIKQGDNQAYLLYLERIKEIEEYLYHLSCYFRILQDLKTVDFNISSIEFFNILCNYRPTTKDDFGIMYLLHIDYDECLTYLISFLKSLEVRQILYYNKKLGLKELKQVLTRKEEIKLDKCLLLDCYENHLYEFNNYNEDFSYTKKI